MVSLNYVINNAAWSIKRAKHKQTDPTYLEKYIGLIYIGRICDFCSGSFVLFVSKASLNTCTFFHVDRETFLDKRLNRGWNNSYTSFIRKCFLWNTD